MSNKIIGLIIKRKNIQNPIIQDLHKELLFYIFEIELLLKALDKFENHQMMFFDSKVGDRKCQTRTSQLIDVLSTELQSFQKSKPDLLNKLQTMQIHLQNFNFNNLKFTPDMIKKFKYELMSDFISTLNIEITIPKNLIFITLCFITTHFSEEQFNIISHSKLSGEKIKRLKALAKIELCKISIEYEQNLAQKYLTQNEHKALEQIELKQFSSIAISMTPLFPSFKVIFQKMKDQQEYFLTKKFILCSCGGIIKIHYNLYKSSNSTITKVSLNRNAPNTVIMIFEGYLFEGSWSTLKTKLNIPQELYPDATTLQKKCECLITSPDKPSNINLETVLLAGFVQHPQFITNSEIDWKGLDLENSKLKKEFDYLKTIPGCSIDDMSQFCIRHVYPSTIADVLKEQEELQQQLGLTATKN